jgi:hypothetical protein
MAYPRCVHRGDERPGRSVKLLVAVKGLSGKLYPAGTELFATGRGDAVDAFVGGDWVPLRWWEFAEGS